MDRKKILLIEHDEDTLFLLSNLLTKRGYAVQACHGGCDVVELKHAVPDLVILDKDLPTIDGIAVCKFLRLRPESKTTPIIMISGRPVRHVAKRAGVDAFLMKPFNLAELLETVDRFFQQFRPTDSVAFA